MKHLILARLRHDEASTPPADESVYFRRSFDLWPEVYLGPPLDDQEPSDEEVWPDAKPGDDGLYHFEVSAELAFTIPGLDGQEEVFEIEGRRVVLTNQMNRLYYAEQAGADESGTDGVLRYVLVHGAGLDYTKTQLGDAPQFVVPLRTFFTCPIAVRAESANAAVRRHLRRWLDQFAADVAFIVDAYRTSDPKNTARFGDVTSIHSFPNVWVAVDAGPETSAYPWTSDFRRTSVTPANGVTEWGRTRTRAVLKGEVPLYRHLLLLSSAYRYAYNGDLARAVVDLSVAMESFLSRELEGVISESRGAEEDADESAGGEWVTYDQLLNDYLPLKLDPDETVDYAEMVGLLNRMRKLRNQVVHAGGFTTRVHASEVDRALDAAGRLINLVMGIVIDEHGGLIEKS